MSGDSRTAGYLVPSSLPEYDDALNDAVIRIVVGITGIDPTLVSPMWQARPPQQPDFSVTWAAAGAHSVDSEPLGYQYHDGTGGGGLGVNTYYRQEHIECIAVFYGPLSQSYAARLRDGFAIWQNRQSMLGENLAFSNFLEIRAVPEKINNVYVRRYDVRFTCNRQIVNTYPVRTIISAPFEQVAETPPE